MKRTFHINQIIQVPHSVDYTFEADDKEFIEIMNKLQAVVTEDDMKKIANGEMIEFTSDATHYPVFDVANNIFRDNAEITPDGWQDWSGDRTFMIEEVKETDDGSISE